MVRKSKKPKSNRKPSWTLTEEGRAEHRRRTSEGMRKWNASRTPEEKAATNAKHRKTIANIAANNPKKMERWKKRIGKSTKRWKREKSPEELADIYKRSSESFKKTYHSWSDEKKEQHRENVSKGMIAVYKQKTVIKRRVNDYCGVISSSDFESL